MRLFPVIVGIFISIAPLTALAQDPVKADTLIQKLDSLAKEKDSTGIQQINIDPVAYNDVTKLNGKSYFILLGSTIKQTFTKPFRMRKKDWLSFGKFAVVAAALSFADKPVQRSALKFRNENSAIRKTGKFISKFGLEYEVVALAGFGAYGVIAKSEKVKTTTLLATQSVVTALLAGRVVKILTGRTRPDYYSEFSRAEPRFLGPFGKFSVNEDGERATGSFPSAHTTAAFSAATVFAVEYRNKPLIPVVAYSIAAMVGLSRVTENRHWATDVFAGAALGYVTGKLVAYNYHRYAILKNGSQKKKPSLSINYYGGRLMTGAVWKL